MIEFYNVRSFYRYGPNGPWQGLEGRELLTQLCKKGVHLDDSSSVNDNIKTRVTRVPKHIITC